MLRNQSHGQLHKKLMHRIAPCTRAGGQCSQVGDQHSVNDVDHTLHRSFVSSSCKSTAYNAVNSDEDRTENVTYIACHDVRGSDGGIVASSNKGHITAQSRKLISDSALVRPPKSAASESKRGNLGHHAFMHPTRCLVLPPRNGDCEGLAH